MEWRSEVEPAGDASNGTKGSRLTGIAGLELQRRHVQDYDPVEDITGDEPLRRNTVNHGKSACSEREAEWRACAVQKGRLRG